MKVKDLKEIVKELPDDMDVIIANEVDTDKFHLVEVTSVGHVHAKFEEHDALAITSSRLTNVKTNTEGMGYETDLLYDNPPEEGYPKLEDIKVPIDYKYLWNTLEERVQEMFDNTPYEDSYIGGYADGKKNAYSYVLDKMKELKENEENK